MSDSDRINETGDDSATQHEITFDRVRHLVTVIASESERIRV